MCTKSVFLLLTLLYLVKMILLVGFSNRVVTTKSGVVFISKRFAEKNDPLEPGKLTLQSFSSGFISKRWVGVEVK
jgi:hypothetical protein